jgi:hypothetical protein
MDDKADETMALRIPTMTDQRRVGLAMGRDVDLRDSWSYGPSPGLACRS